MKTIEVPDDLYKELEKRAIPFEDKEPADVIRRIIDYPRIGSAETDESTCDNGSDLHCRGGMIHHGTRLRKTYKGHSFEAEVLNGKILLNGNSYLSPSEAANAAVCSVGPQSSSINGWIFWEFLDTTTRQWKPLTESQGYEHHGVDR